MDSIHIQRSFSILRDSNVPVRNKCFKPTDAICNVLADTEERFNDRIKINEIDAAEEYVNGRLWFVTLLDRDSTSASNDKPMLVRDVEEMKNIEPLPFPSYVTLKVNDELNSIFPEPLCFYSFTSGFVVLGGSFRSRKYKAILWLSTIEFNQFPHRMIERRSQVVNCVADDERKLDWRLLSEVGIDGLASTLRIYANRDSVRVVLEKPMSSDLKIADVMVGPI